LNWKSNSISNYSNTAKLSRNFKAYQLKCFPIRDIVECIPSPYAAKFRLPALPLCSGYFNFFFQKRKLFQVQKKTLQPYLAGFFENYREEYYKS